jgi:hypothetical protein
MASVASCKDFARSCDPIPYRMTVEVSRQGIDCSGFMSVLFNCLTDRDIWVRRFATGTISSVAAGLGLKAGKGNPATDFEIGVMFPWESPSGIGHMAGTLAGLNVESRGGTGVLIGAAARGSRNSLFGHHYHLVLTEEDMTPEQATQLKELHGVLTQSNLDRLALWVAGRANRVYSPDGIASRLGVDVDFERPATREELLDVATFPSAADIAVAVVALLPEGSMNAEIVENAVERVLNRTHLSAAPAPTS